MSDEQDGGSGLIIGIVIGGVVVVGLAALALFWLIGF